MCGSALRVLLQVAKVLNVWQAKKLVPQGILKLAREVRRARCALVHVEVVLTRPCALVQVGGVLARPFPCSGFGPATGQVGWTYPALVWPVQPCNHCPCGGVPAAAVGMRACVAYVYARAHTCAPPRIAAKMVRCACPALHSLHRWFWCPEAVLHVPTHPN